ncbi:nucleotidyltransferase domain-containing protein [[Eubacterium] rectale]|nr:nucleotidyltransferase domain-containing protein [Agathobacter rectalis]
MVFGSSVRDDCTVESDIDILLYVNKNVNLDTIYFNNIYRHIGIVADDLCDVLINTIISKKLLKHIEKYGVIIYEIIPTKI